MSIELSTVISPKADQASFAEAYSAQRNFTQQAFGGAPEQFDLNEGSPAIAFGRTAGFALLAGDNAAANEAWGKLQALSEGKGLLPEGAFPSLEGFFAGAQKNPAAFAEFANAKNFPAAGTPFSNAAGSYAFALDCARRGEKALAGGELESVMGWCAKALRAAGFEEQAQVFDKMAVRAVAANDADSITKIQRA